MARNYYYLVAGLPDILLDGGKKTLSVAEFLDEVRAELHPGDTVLFDLLRYPADNKNLLALLEKTGGEFDPRGVYTAEDLAAHVKAPDALPRYMQTFIEAHHEGRQLFPGLSLENQLEWLFYDEVCGHARAFVGQWFTFEMNLRNVLAALACRIAAQGPRRDQAFEMQRAIVGRNDVAQTILRSTAPDFSLSAQLPWVERLVGLSRDNLVEFEKSIDTLRWDMLNDLTVFSYFEVETLLAFCIKLGMVERWQGLDESEGEKRFTALVEELAAGFHVQQDL